LQELWDWVTESKTQSANHHVNVILFGESAWAEKAKKWLPKRNSNRPVLLSTQSVDSTKFDVNALEALMAEERSTFSLDLFGRKEFSPPVVTQKWFIVSVLILFMSVFVGLMTWQYPEHVKSLLQTGKLPSDAALNADQLALLNEKLEMQLKSKEDTTDMAQSTTQVEPGYTPNKVQTSSTSDNTDLVTSWDAAKKVSSDKIDSLKENINDQRATTGQNTAPTTNVEESASLREVLSIDVTDTYLADADGDFAVEDIISVEQLDANLEKDTVASSQQEQVAIDTLALANKVDEDAPEQAATPVIQELTTEGFYEFTEAALLTMPEPAILLQLFGIKNKLRLNEFITDNQLQDLVWIYQTTRYGGAWYVVLFNQRFDSADETRQAVELLPSALRTSQPFAKDLRQIKLEIRNR
jgi:DamX protein